MRILVVEDEEVVRNVVEAYLDSSGHSVVSCPDYATAEAVDPESFDLVITDESLPHGQRGSALISRWLPKHPHLKFILMSGYRDQMTVPASRCRFLAKPFTRRELLETIHQVSSVA